MNSTDRFNLHIANIMRGINVAGGKENLKEVFSILRTSSEDGLLGKCTNVSCDTCPFNISNTKIPHSCVVVGFDDNPSHTIIKLGKEGVTKTIKTYKNNVLDML